MPSNAVQPGVHARPTSPPTPAASQPGHHRQLRASKRLMRKLFRFAEKLGRTVTVLAMIALTSAALLLSVNAPNSGTGGAVPAASYNE